MSQANRSLRDSIVSSAGRLLARAFGDGTAPAGFRPKNVLVIKTCCIGDVLMATPMLSALREAFPAAKISLAVGSWSKSVVEGNPDIDDIIDCGSIAGGRRFSLAEYFGVVRQLRVRQFDCCFVLERSALLTALPWIAGIPVRVGLDSGGRGFSLTVRVAVPDRRHEAELYLDTVRAIGYEPVGPRMKFVPSQADRARADAALAACGDGPIVAVHPGGGVNPGMRLVAKRWPAERYAAVADRLVASGCHVVLVGDAGDREVVSAVKRHMRSAGVDLAGQLTLGELGAVLARCRLAVANDTGPMHLAVAVGTPVVAIFGPSDPLVYGPYGQSDAVASSGLACSPCFKHGRTPRCIEPKCMSSLSVEAVWALVEARLQAPRTGSTPPAGASGAR